MKDTYKKWSPYKEKIFEENIYIHSNISQYYISTAICIDSICSLSWPRGWQTRYKFKKCKFYCSLLKLNLCVTPQTMNKFYRFLLSSLLYDHYSSLFVKNILHYVCTLYIPIQLNYRTEECLSILIVMMMMMKSAAMTQKATMTLMMLKRTSVITRVMMIKKNFDDDDDDFQQQFLILVFSLLIGGKLMKTVNIIRQF